jgi:heptosyltransferase-3
MLIDAVPLDQVRRALVVKLRHHGDVLLASPVFSVLRRAAPHAELDALVYRDTREMIELHPAIARVHTVDREWKRGGLLSQLAREAGLLRELRARRYDLVIHLTDHRRGAWVARLLGARWRVAHGYPQRRGRLWRASFTHLYSLPATPRHTVEQHLDALRRIGVQPQAGERGLVLVAGAAAEAAVQAILEGAGLRGRDFIHLHPTSRWLFKCWPVEKTAALIDALHAAGERVVLTAAPDERELEMVRAILARVRQSPLDCSGRLTLKQLAALSARAKCFVGVDSVPMHIAAAMRTPAVALFGPSNELLWGPWQARHRVLRAPFSCRPCGLDGCGGGKRSECLDAIEVDQVREAMRDLLAER